MRISRTAHVLGLGAAAGLLVVGTISSAAQAAAVVTVDSVTFSSPALTVSGTQTASQTVTAHIVDPDGPAVPPPPNTVEWVFELSATGGSGTLHAITVLAASTGGTFADGTWSATVHVPSTADGTWTLSSVEACSGDLCPGNITSVTPAGATSFTVTGHHQPRFSVGWDLLPYPSRLMLVKGRVVDADTGQGMPGVVVGFGADTGCIEFPPDGPIRFLVEKQTDARGYYSFGPVSTAGLQCAGVWGTDRHNSDGYSILPAFRSVNTTAWVKPAVTVTTASTRGKVGTPLLVNGTVRATVPGGIHLILQQLHGRTAWRAVGYTTVRGSGRWSSGVIPTTEGARNVYRVISVATPTYVIGTSRAFVVTGTCRHKGCSYVGAVPPYPW